MAIEIGTTLKGTVVKVADYGAIVRLPEGQSGLIHISEIANAYVRDIREYLNENDQVAVKVLRLNDKGRYELSVKQCVTVSREDAPKPPVTAEPAGPRTTIPDTPTKHSQSPPQLLKTG